MDASGVSVSFSGAAIPRSPASDLAVEAPSGEWSRTSTTLQDILGSADNENHGAAANEDMYSYGSERMMSGISDDQDDVADVVDDFGANGEPPSEIVELENRLALLPVLVKQNSDLRGLWDAERERAGTLSEAIGHLQSEVRAVSAARDEARLWEGLYRFRLELHQRRTCGEVMDLIRADLPALLQVPSCELIMADDADSTRPTRLTEAIAFVLEHRETLESDGMRFVPIFADAHGVCAVLRIEGAPSRQPEAIAQSACEEIGVVLAYCLVDRLKDETLASVNKALADAEHRLGSSDDDIDRRGEALRIGGEVIAEAIEQTSLHDSEIHFIELLERGIRTCVQADLCALQFMDKRIEVQKALAVSTSLQVTLGDRRAELILGRRQRIHGSFEPWEQAVALKLAENVWGLYELSKKLAQKTAEIQDRKTDMQQSLEAAEARIGQMQSAHSRAARIEALYTLVSRLLASDSEESLVKIVQEHVPNVLEVASVRLVLRQEPSYKDSSPSSTQAFHIHEDAHLIVDGKPNDEWADTVVDLVGCALDQARKRNQNVASIASLSAACARSRDDAQANESLRLRAEAESVRIAETARVILEKLASPKPPSLEQVCLMAQESVNTVVAPDEHAAGHRQWVRVLILDLDSMDESNLFELDTDQEDTISARASTREPIARVVVPSNLQNIKVRLGQGLVGRVLSSGRTHIVTGDRIAREEALVRDLDRPDTSALLCVPIVGSRAAEALSPAQSNDGDAQRVWASSSGLASGVLGCIQVARVAAGSSFGELDGKLVRMIAGHLARQIELARAQTRADDSFTQSATARSEIADFAAVLCALEVPRSSEVSLLQSHIIPLVEKLGCRLRVAEDGSSPSAGKQEHVRRFETRTLESRHQGKSDHVLLSCSKPTAVFHYLCDVMPLALRLADALEQIGADASSLRSRDLDLSQVQAERDELASNVERFRKLVAIAASMGGSNAPAKTSETSHAAVVSPEEDPVERLSWYVEELFGSQLHGIWYSKNAVPAIFKSACEEAVNAPHWAGVPAGEAHVLVVEEDRESEVPFSPGRRLLGRDDLEILILLASWLGRAHQRFAQISQLQVALRDASQGLSDTRAGAEGAASSLSITSEAMRMIIACTEMGFLERHTLDVETLRDELPAWISRGAPEGLSCTLLDNEKALEAAIRAGHVIIESPCEHETGLMVSVAGAEEVHVTAAFAVAHVHAFALTRALEAQRESADREDLSVQLHQSRHHVFLQDLALRMGAGANVADAIGTEGILRNQCADLCAELGASFVHAFELGPGGVLTCRTLPSSLQAAMPNVGESCSLVLHPPLPADFRKLVDANPVSPHPIDAGAPWVERCTLTLAHNAFERCRLVFVAGHILSEGETLNAEHVRDFLERAVCLIGNAFETRHTLEDLRSEKAQAEEGLQSAIEAHTRLEAAKEDLEKRFFQAKALDETLSALASASTVEEIATLILAHLESGHPGRCCLFIRQDITAFQEQEGDATMVDWTEPARQTSDDGLVGVCSKSQTVIFIQEDLVSDARYVYRIDGAGMASHPSSLVCVPILASLHAEEKKSTLGVICVANPERSRIDSLSVLASASALALAGQTLHHAKEAAQEALRDVENAMVDVKRSAVTGEDLARLQRRSEVMIKKADTAIARAVSVATSGGVGEYEKNKDDRDPLGVLMIWTVDVLSAADMEQMQARCESLRRPLKRCLEELCAVEAKCTFEGISVASPDRAGVFLYLLEDSAKALKGDAEVVCKSKSPYLASRSRRIAIPCSYRDSKGVVRVVGVLHVCRGGGFDATSSLAALQHIGELVGAFMRRVLRERASLAKSMAYEKRVSQLEHLASTRKSSASPRRPGTAQVGGRDGGSSGMLSRDLLEKCNKLEDQLMDAELSLERADRDRASLRTALQQAEKKVEQLRTAVKRADARQHEIETNAAVVLESARKMKADAEVKRNGADSDCELFDESKVMISENLSRSALAGGPAMTAVAAAMRSRPLPPPHPSGTLKELQRVCEQMRESQTKRAASIRELINLEQVQLDGEAKLSASRLPAPFQLGTPIQTVPWSTVKRVAQRSAQKAVSQQRREGTRTRPQLQEEPK
ncbi:Hypothetical Protein FCC1311_047152 [Hondaea fermentalgiana]|uniref:GAF domain-containing protein n=1 Tax=Hondaea fermentalgiana TaxID=2315210 RepID=A0A2R5GBW9_9STRA|nr:Hypothetical Protein FCC1311_047152 [Hondaea fermentalgiana]|eukprot:GBG28492.1 Hypothetical Protein FCC1311_047152 [Hondaea fermentalgiana]